jgi:hypothetical protein
VPLTRWMHRTIRARRNDAWRGVRRGAGRAAIIASLACATAAVTAQTIVDGPTACGANPYNLPRFNENALQSGTLFGTHSLPIDQCVSLQPGESCVGVYAYSVATGVATDIFVGPPPRLVVPSAGYPDSIAIDPNNPSHLFYISRDELVETLDLGQHWTPVNDMVAVRALAGRPSGDYILRFMPDGMTLFEGNQVSVDSGASWQTLAHFPKLVTHQSVEYDYGYNYGWRSNDGGSVWSALSLTGYPSNFGNSWTVDAKDSTLVYALVSGNFGFRIARSRDGGDHWTVLLAIGPGDGVNLQRILASADTAGTVYMAGSAGGGVRLWKSVDAGDTWTSFGSLPAAHLSAAQCGSVVGLDGALLTQAEGTPLVFGTSAGSMILFDAPGAAPPNLRGASSRKQHGSIGTQDAPLSLVFQ